MRIKLFVLGTMIASAAAAVPFHIRITADNHYAVYSGTAAAALTYHATVSGAWPTVMVGTVTPPPTHTHVYVVAHDDGNQLQGLLATIAVGGVVVGTGSALWTVCATSANPSSLRAVTSRIATCNNNGAWRATSNGPSDGSAALPEWAPQPQIDNAASWIWDDRPGAPCLGPPNPPPFLRGACDPGERLIFRIALRDIAECRPPVPDFSLGSGACGGLLANGTNSQGVQNHFWSIQESDQSWNPIGPEISQWFSGPPGVFDLKAFFESQGQRLTCCGGYYRVKLAVANPCVSWRDLVRLVKTNCCPVEVISPDPPDTDEPSP